MIGLSGLITPSLGRNGPRRARDETQEDGHSAVDRRGDDQCQAHRRQDRPAYDGPIVHVLDASRSVDVVEKLISREHRDGFIAENVDAAEEAGRQLPGPQAEAGSLRRST